MHYFFGQCCRHIFILLTKGNTKLLHKAVRGSRIVDFVRNFYGKMEGEGR